MPGFAIHTPRPVVNALAFSLSLLVLAPLAVVAQSAPDCSSLPNHDRLRTILQSVVKEGANGNGGLGTQEWASVVNRDGIVCAVVFSGATRGDQWPGSRIISASKASTANALSGKDSALSTANLYAGAQPWNSLFSMTTSAPPNPQAAYAGPATAFGTASDPFVGKPIGGVIVFGGGLALYTSQGKIVGGLGLSGNTSCADHVEAWKVRHMLQLDAVPHGVAPDGTDNMIQDIQNNESPSGFGHPKCKGGMPSADIIKNLPKNFPAGPKK